MTHGERNIAIVIGIWVVGVSILLYSLFKPSSNAG